METYQIYSTRFEYKDQKGNKWIALGTNSDPKLADRAAINTAGVFKQVVPSIVFFSASYTKDEFTKDE